jgi:hypothetical protein
MQDQTDTILILHIFMIKNYFESRSIDLGSFQKNLSCPTLKHGRKVTLSLKYARRIFLFLFSTD